MWSLVRHSPNGFAGSFLLTAFSSENPSLGTAYIIFICRSNIWSNILERSTILTYTITNTSPASHFCQGSSNPKTPFSFSCVQPSSCPSSTTFRLMTTDDFVGVIPPPPPAPPPAAAAVGETDEEKNLLEV